MKSLGIIVKAIDIPMRDGTLLRADLFIKDDNSPHFTLLQRTPYSRECSISLINALDLARQGWAVVIQNVRGRLDSAGEFSPFLQELTDGLDTLNWISGQSWSNSKIAMSGTSYCGFTQWSCSYTGSKYLGAISPQLTASNVLDHWFYENDLFRHSFAQSWGLSLSHTVGKEKTQKEKIVNFAKNLTGLYKVPPQESPLKDLFPPYNNWLDSKDKVYWGKIGKIEKSKGSPIPAFHLTGWYDIFCEGAIEDYKSLQSNAVSVGIQNQRLIIGPWGHNTLFHHRVGQVNFGYEADGFTHDIMQEVHHWLYQALNKNPLKSGVKIFIMGENKWKDYLSWPPKPFNIMRLYFEGNKDPYRNELKINPPSQNESCTLHYNPSNLPKSLGGRTLDPASLDAGPFDHAGILESDGSLLFIFPPLNKPITVVGEIFIDLFIRPQNDALDLSFTIFDKHPDGGIYNIVSRSHHKKNTPHKVTKLTLSIGNTAMMFKEGHSIYLRITSSHFPHLVNRDSFHKYQESEILFGRDYPSCLYFPIQEKLTNIIKEN